MVYMKTTNTTATLPQTQTQTRSFLLVLGIVLIAANLRSAITSIGPLVGIIGEDTGLSSVFTGLLTTLPLIAFAIISPLAPKIARRFGMEATLFASLIFLATGIFIRSITSSILLLFTGTALIGVTIAIANVLLPSLIKRDFPNKIGLMTGAYSVSMGICASLASGLSIPLIQNLGFSWRGSLMCWALLAVAGILVWLPQLRSHQHSSNIQANKAVPTSNLWRSKLAWQVTLFMGLQSLAFYITIAWLPEILHDRGMSIVNAGWMLSLMQFVSLPATFIVPVLATKRPSQRGLVAIFAIISLIGYIGLLFDSTNVLAALWIMLIGLGQGALISLALTFFGLRTTNAGQAAALSGMAQSIGYLLAAIGPILFGLLHEMTNSWTTPILMVIIAMVSLLVAGLGAGRGTKITMR